MKETRQCTALGRTVQIEERPFTLTCVESLTFREGGKNMTRCPHANCVYHEEMAVLMAHHPEVIQQWRQQPESNNIADTLRDMAQHGKTIREAIYQVAMLTGGVDYCIKKEEQAPKASTPQVTQKNIVVFRCACLSCGKPLKDIVPLGCALEGGEALCPHCHEVHNYMITAGTLTLHRVTVPLGHSGVTEKKYSPVRAEMEKLQNNLRRYDREEEDEILEAISSGQISLAFKLYREKYGGTAQQAKEFIDDLRGSKVGTKQSMEQNESSPPLSKYQKHRKWWQFWK